MKQVIEKLAKLIDVKSIVTILLTVTFVILCFIGKISGDQFIVIFTSVIAFYFGYKNGKKDGDK